MLLADPFVTIFIVFYIGSEDVNRLLAGWKPIFKAKFNQVSKLVPKSSSELDECTYRFYYFQLPCPHGNALCCIFSFFKKKIFKICMLMPSWIHVPCWLFLFLPGYNSDFYWNPNGLYQTCTPIPKWKRNQEPDALHFFIILSSVNAQFGKTKDYKKETIPHVL